MIEIQRGDALDRTGALVFGCANMLYISLVSISLYMCVCVCMWICVRMDCMICFWAICSKVGMAFNLAPVRQDSGEKKSFLIQYVLFRKGVLYVCLCVRSCVCVHCMHFLFFYVSFFYWLISFFLCDLNQTSGTFQKKEKRQEKL